MKIGGNCECVRLTECEKEGENRDRGQSQRLKESLDALCFISSSSAPPKLSSLSSLDLKNQSKIKSVLSVMSPTKETSRMFSAVYMVVAVVVVAYSMGKISLILMDMKVNK